MVKPLKEDAYPPPYLQGCESFMGINSPSPSIVQTLPTTCTPDTHCSKVQQTLSMDGSEVNVIFKSVNSCLQWYTATSQYVPEIIKPKLLVKNKHLQIKLPQGGM